MVKGEGRRESQGDMGIWRGERQGMIYGYMHGKGRWEEWMKNTLINHKIVGDIKGEINGEINLL